MVSVEMVEAWLAEAGLPVLEDWQRESLRHMLNVSLDQHLTRSVLSSVSAGAMPWLTAADEAAKQLALSYAATIDEAIAAGDPLGVTKALYLGPHLLRTLDQLGGTPAGRKQASSQGSGKGGPRGRLYDLKAQAEKRSTG